MTANQGLIPHYYNSAQRIPDILGILRLSHTNPSLTSHFSEAFEIRGFQLGDELASYNLNIANSQEHDVQNEQNEEGFYVVCQGRIRLLGWDTTEGREVSAIVLEAGDSFGTETFFTSIPALSRAITASDGEIAWMPLTQLQPWLEQLPQLREHLATTALVRAMQVFCKTSTDLRCLSVRQLQQLIPYLVETRIPAEAALTQYSHLGRFWLCSGQVSQSEPVNAIAVGKSWGYPHPIPDDWTAQTDLVVYKLPIEHWEVAINIGGIATESKESTAVAIAANNGHPRPGLKPPVAARRQDKTLPTPRPQPAQEQPSSATAQAEGIAFPQPIRRRLHPAWWQRYPFIQQQSSSDCGAACLAMIGQYWGKQFSLNSLRNLAGVGRAGASLKGLSSAAESLGFQSRPVRASLSSLLNRQNPWVAHWEGNHYIVVYWVKGDRVHMADPAVGKRTLSRAEFTAGWTGYALLLEPTLQLAAAENEKNSLDRFWRMLWPYRAIVGQIILASLLLQVFGLITPLFTQIILDRVVVNKSLITLHVFSIGLLLFGVWRIGLTTTRQYLLDYFSNRLDLIFISGFINHTLKLPLKFFESRQVGDIITRVQEAQKIQVFLTRKAVLTCLDALMVFVYVGLMSYYNWQLTLLVLSLIPPFVILTVVASPFLRQVSREIFKEDAAQNSLVVEMIMGVATVKASASEQEVRWRWEDRLTSMLNVKFKGQKLGNGLQSLAGLINSIGNTALLWYGASLVIQGQLTIGQFVAFNMLIGNVINPILGLVNLWDEFQEVLVSVERLNDVFAAQPEEDPQNPLLVLPTLRGEVHFENVTFRYDEDEQRNTLQNISFEVNSGQTIAIVGRSGSGKSTLVKLLQGLYHPTTGRIFIDGHDIEQVSLQSLRSQLGVVPQECFLFSGTVLENITIYRNDFTLEEAVEASKLAEAHAFIQALPLGYNTKVGEQGSTLSGGQRQRIAIARALLGNPRVLVLDEATSSLDTESERRFQQNLTRISRDRTTFIIAHRLSTVRNADCILVLDRGVLVERGTHEELMAFQGLYYHLAQQQLDL